MKEILYIILVVVTRDNPNYNSFDIHQEGFKDTWYTDKRTDGGFGISIRGNEHHYKSILFYSQNAFDAYLKAGNNLNGCIILDIKKGTQKVIKSTPIKQTIEKEVIIGYENSFE